ncbi:PGF-CTERM sorting domain-containing protein [Salinirubellus salinus]|uniref:PGF-CTERM sorting domain-containing protein n=1 Tax=Salinirubellus salinus TaxID=1364945 RepID=A0A9E7UCZ5_9EURY|nr:PGF-CTERM sorting domain-containing protein [Salinirubellus salinus]UWM56822.1 PGF-CTERM sorting domain-containing protein [Salinirubellus salinus]
MGARRRVVEYGVRAAADRWGDARKALTLFRQAGETATETGPVTPRQTTAQPSTTATSGDRPGFGPVAALIGLLAATLLLARRR